MKKANVAQAPAVPNEARARRWVLFFVLANVGALVVMTVTGVTQRFWQLDGAWYWLPDVLCSLTGFALSLVVTAWLSRKVLKTTLRELILGIDGFVDWRQCGKIVLAWAAGFVLTVAVDCLLGGSDGVTTFNPVGFVPVAVNFVICTLLVWTQTTWEEVMYRCVFLRATCGNDIRPTFKCIAWGVLSTAVFMACHFFNPEVTSQTQTPLIVMACLTYFVAGMGMYLADVVYGTCMPGCVIHWVNNFFLFTIWTQSGSALESAAIFYTQADRNGQSSLVGTLLLYVPLAVLLVHDWRKMHRAK